MTRNVHSGLAPLARIDIDNLPDDRHQLHILRSLHRIVPPPTQPAELTWAPLGRERPASYRIAFEPRPRKSLLRRIVNALRSVL